MNPADESTNAVINGWNLSFISNWQTGLPFTAFAAGDNSLSAIGNDGQDITVANIARTKPSSGRSHAAQANEWFNTDDFVANATGTYRNIGKNSLRGPRLFTTDLTLMKAGKAGERIRYEFRAEFYNVFNNVNFGLPDAFFPDGPGVFGAITSANDPRILQMALKLSF
jgi:hypothetical protein